jgi:hypothetical protein
VETTGGAVETEEHEAFGEAVDATRARRDGPGHARVGRAEGLVGATTVRDLDAEHTRDQHQRDGRQRQDTRDHESTRR